MSSRSAKMRVQPQSVATKDGIARSEMNREGYGTRVLQRKERSGCLAIRAAMCRGYRDRIMPVEEQSVRAAGRLWLSAFGIIRNSFGLE